ncbi:MAG: hypothetical protein K6G67_08530 [Lachnospiraceae bacterium]|nr:hypothetical protein [Lachnospiraceae bacterium]
MNKSGEMYVNNTEENASAALQKIDEFISHQNIDGKKMLHLRLLAEETIGMVKAMTTDFMALLWVEEEDGVYRIRLTVKTDMNKEKKSELLSVSTSGKNAAAKGFMGKIGEIIENGLLNYDNVMKLQQEYGSGYSDYIGMGMCVPGEIQMAGDPLVWSLSKYRASLDEGSDNEVHVDAAWDELEKSIVASLAKDVAVGVRKDRVDMVITAK